MTLQPAKTVRAAASKLSLTSQHYYQAAKAGMVAGTDTRAFVFLLLAMSAALSIVFQSFKFGDSYNNNAFHIPIILDYFGSEEGPHDFIHRSLKNYVSGFWIVLSWITNENTLYETLLAVHFLHRTAVLCFLYGITSTLLQKPPRLGLTLLIACMPFTALLQSQTPVGFSNFFANYVTHTDVVTSIILGAWFFTVRRQWLLAALMLGVGFNVNAFAAVWNALLVGSAYLWISRDEDWGPIIKTCLLMAAVFLVTAMPNLVWIFQTMPSESAPEVPYDFREYLRAFFPFHHLVDSQVHNLFKMILLSAAAGLALKNVLPHLVHPQRQVLSVFLIAALSIVAFGCVLPYATDSRLLFMLFPLRMDAYVVILLYIALILAVAVDSERSEDSAQGPSPAPYLALLSLFLGNLALLLFVLALDVQGADRRSIMLKSILALLLIALAVCVLAFAQTPFFPFNGMAQYSSLVWFLIGVLCLTVPALVRERDASYTLSILICAFAIASFLPVAHVKSSWPPTRTLGTSAWPAGLLIALFGVLLFVPRRNRIVQIVAVASSLAALVAAAVQFGSKYSFEISFLVVGMAIGIFLCFKNPPRWSAIIQGQSFATLLVVIFFAYAVNVGVQSNGRVNRLIPVQNDFLAAQVWARANTEPESMFLTSLKPGGFWTFSRRPVWVDSKTGSAVMWWPAYWSVWKKRIQEVSALETLPQWIDYAQANDMRYVLVGIRELPKGSLRKAKVLYRNSRFAVIDASGTVEKSGQ